jgi:5'-3' exonuclease
MGQYTGPLVIIDGHNTLIRNYVRSPYMNSNGERMGGTTGMVISVRKLISDLGASNVLVVWDGEGGSQRRRSIHSEYKAGRTVRLNRADDDMAVSAEEQLANFKQQFDLAKEYLTMLGVPQVRADGVEADDLMAFVAAHMDHPNGVVIVSTDQDMLQLVREKSEDHSEVKVWSPIRKIMYDTKTFISDYGVLPENFRLVKALTGDTSDNIEGVKGFGAKTVPKSFPFLVERRATAEEVITAAESLKGTLGKRLTEEKSKFLENLSLVDLSEPMLSATAARSAREALERDLGCKEVEFRMRVVRDGISFGGTNFIDPFRDLVARRRRMLAAHTKVETEESK